MTQIALKNKNRWKARLLAVSFLVLLGLGVAASQWQQAQASSSWLMQAESKYPTIVGTALDNCDLCHTSAPSLNSYGSAFATHSHSFTAIESLDSDGDGYTNLTEINAHTFPGDRNSHPVAAPTATRTQAPPTATATNTRVPSTATSMPVPATVTRTPVPATATSTATRVSPTATPINTSLPATVTSTREAPTATSTALVPTATSTRTTSTATKTPTKVPPAARPIAFRDVIRQLPETKTLIGNWLVGNRTVHVTSQTKISRDDDGAAKVGNAVIVRGTVQPDGSVNAASITVQEDEKGKRLRGWLKALRRLFGRSDED